jgi:hypothetical protein
MTFILTDTQKYADGKPRVSSTPYLYDIAEGLVKNHAAWSKIGYTPTLTTSESDIWSAAGVYAFATGAETWEAIGGASDDATPIARSGNSTGGSTTSLIDAGANFTAATAVAIGDTIILDKSGTTPEYGIVTGVAATTLTVAGGFSKGGSGAGPRAYAILPVADSTGAHAVLIQYLTTAFAEKEEIIVLNGAAAVSAVNADFYRVQSFRVIAAGSANAAVGALTLRVAGGGATRSYITAGFTRARNSCYTVPAGKTLYITQFSAAWADTGNANKEYARLYTRANYNNGFNTGNIFYPYTEILIQNNTAPVTLLCPTKLPTGVDIKVSGIASTAGVATVVLRGWLES